MPAPEWNITENSSATHKVQKIQPKTESQQNANQHRTSEVLFPFLGKGSFRNDPKKESN